jgi:hypothetical protein
MASTMHQTDGQHHAKQGQAVVGDVEKASGHIVCKGLQTMFGGLGPGFLRCHSTLLIYGSTTHTLWCVVGL